MSGVPISQILRVLQQRDEHQPPRGDRRWAARREQWAELLVLVDDAELIADADGQAALRESGVGNGSRLLGHWVDGVRVQGHGGAPPGAKSVVPPYAYDS